MAASTYPHFFRVRQKFERSCVADVAGEVRKQLAQLSLGQKIRPGQTVAITAGSRGIANIAIIIKAVVDSLKSLGAAPFIVPAMGSHGGGTAEGQRELLAGYHITEAYCGCPIRASMETVIVCQAAEGFPIHFDRHAFEADHVLVCGRIKPHTEFSGGLESGLMKMMLIGLGKRDGAVLYHRAFKDFSFEQIARSVAPQVIGNCRILAGLGIVENAYDETAKIEAMLPGQIASREAELLVLAKRWMPRLPFPWVDVLIVDEIGKNISGTGIDTNVVGRKHDYHKAVAGESPVVRRIIARSLTPLTHGNATGIGMTEFCKTSLVEQADWKVTWLNCITSGNIGFGMMPIHMSTDRELIDAAISTIGLTEAIDSKILWIKNTLQLAEVECSTRYLEEARLREDLEIIAPPRRLPLDAAGNLPIYA
ncbi:MAG: DUF2088 domain-containing protein [Pirellulales bacterium]|nr:DUF2088 domain-containing protein [Pirellulales bacterium]